MTQSKKQMASLNDFQGKHPSDKGHIVVIGAGFGGLAAAIRLQALGFRVTLLEAQAHPGGRAGQIKDQGFTFDMGPTLITAPHLLEELWQLAGRDLHDDVELIPLSPFYRILFADGRSFDYWGMAEQDEAEIACFEPRDVQGYWAFLTAAKHIYERAFVDLAGQPFLTPGDLLRVTPELIRLGGHRSVYAFVSRYFRHPYLRMVFSFHPLFIGGNPFRASAIYSIVPYLERSGGVHFARGGMSTLVQAMATLFCSIGGEIRYNAPVEQILLKERQVRGVRIQNGTTLAANAVVANSDVARTYLELLPREYLPASIERYRYSMSCFLLYLGVRREYTHLRHHTIVMPERYRALIHEIFDGRGLPADLALYLHTPTRTDATMAPPGCESLYVLAPVPNLAHGVDWSREATAFRDRIIQFLEQQCGLTGLSENIVAEQMFTPLDFASQLRSHLGAAFSIEPTLLQSAYFRPHNRSHTLDSLYFVGAGTHPGAGIPGVLLSADLTSRLVYNDAMRV
jgi:phytoene desaturase